jgi:hypothetical protein
MSRYSVRRGFLPDASHRFAHPVGLGFAALFLASIPAAYLDTGVAQVMWIGAAFLHYPLRRVAERAPDTSA